MFKYIRPWREKREANQVDSASGKRKSVPSPFVKALKWRLKCGKQSSLFRLSEIFKKKSSRKISVSHFCADLALHISWIPRKVCRLDFITNFFFRLPERCSKEFFYFYFAAMAPERRVASNPVWNWKESPPLLPCTVIIGRHDYKRIWWTHCSTPVQDGSLDVRL